jgi:hypothetical protein
LAEEGNTVLLTLAIPTHPVNDPLNPEQRHMFNDLITLQVSQFPPLWQGNSDFNLQQMSSEMMLSFDLQNTELDNFTNNFFHVPTSFRGKVQ